MQLTRYTDYSIRVLTHLSPYPHLGRNGGIRLLKAPLAGAHS